jgi:hypothetical protein
MTPEALKVIDGLILFTFLVAVMLAFTNPRLRLHSFGVLLSAAAWATSRAVFLTSAKEFGFGVVLFDCCWVCGGGYHLLLTITLGVGVLREGIWQEALPSGDSPPEGPEATESTEA